MWYDQFVTAECLYGLHFSRTHKILWADPLVSLNCCTRACGKSSGSGCKRRRTNYPCHRHSSTRGKKHRRFTCAVQECRYRGYENSARRVRQTCKLSITALVFVVLNSRLALSRSDTNKPKVLPHYTDLKTTSHVGWLASIKFIKVGRISDRRPPLLTHKMKTFTSRF